MSQVDQLEYYDSETEQIVKLMDNNLNMNNLNDWKVSVSVLSEEFETLGLPTVDANQDLVEILQQITDNSLSVVHLYRRLLEQLRDTNINNKQHGTKNNELEKRIISLQDELKRCNDKNKLFENKILRLNDECSDLKKQIENYVDEIKRIKRYYKTKQNELNAVINRLTDEVEHLKQICGKSIGQYFSKDEVLAKTINDYKHNEEIYKETIKKLERNNSGLLVEVFKLKEELTASGGSSDNTTN